MKRTVSNAVVASLPAPIQAIRLLNSMDTTHSLRSLRKIAQVAPFVMPYAQFKMPFTWFPELRSTRSTEEQHLVLTTPRNTSLEWNLYQKQTFDFSYSSIKYIRIIKLNLIFKFFYMNL